MNNKRTILLEEAAKLFSEKGYLATSVQDIVKRCDISKGSFYNYFKSKEEIAFQIFKKKREDLWETLDEIAETNDFSAKELFAAQLKIQFQHLFMNRELLEILFRNSDDNKELTQLIIKSRLQDLHWLSKQIFNVYGEGISRYLYDCATLFVGIAISYSFHAFMNNCQKVDLDELVQYMLRRLDGIVASYSTDEEPLFTQQTMIDFMQIEKQETLHFYQRVKTIISALRSTLNQIKLEKKHFEKIVACLDTFEDEFSKTEVEPREHIIEGLLLYLDKQKLSDLDADLHKLSNLIHSRI